MIGSNHDCFDQAFISDPHTMYPDSDHNPPTDIWRFVRGAHSLYIAPILVALICSFIFASKQTDVATRNATPPATSPAFAASKASQLDSSTTSPSDDLVHVGSRAGEERDDNVVRLRFCWCPAGTFRMGSPESDRNSEGDERPQVNVTLSRGFWLAKHEVTQDQWKAVMGTTPWAGKDSVIEAADCAASSISGVDAIAFCKTLSASERKVGRLHFTEEYRLPTEAEWEYACRAGTTTRFGFGDDTVNLDEYAWYGKNADEVGQPFPHQVGLKKPNAWGLHDMHGNTWEWCSDGYDHKLAGGRDPLGSAKGGVGWVIRGGCWYLSAESCRSAYRGRCNPEDGGSYIGFRVALSASGR